MLEAVQMEWNVLSRTAHRHTVRLAGSRRCVCLGAVAPPHMCASVKHLPVRNGTLSNAARRCVETTSKIDERLASEASPLTLASSPSMMFHSIMTSIYPIYILMEPFLTEMARLTSFPYCMCLGPKHTAPELCCL
mmetsp:Transcript_29592/g.61968  ORF Transcript_29592/g.61968 Transcript_29592/m.61968 type:complete len:135 (+) Transcript_29592:13-417(+)